MKARPRASQAALPRAPLDLVQTRGFRHADMMEAVLAGELPPAGAVPVIRAYRLVIAWSQGPDAWPAPGQAALFGWERGAWQSPDSGLPLWAPLGAIASELEDPAAADPEWLALACGALSRWAGDIGAHGTAALFAEAAALACPTNPWVGFAAGDLLAWHGRPREAERWLSRAGTIAVWNRDWEARTAVLCRLGALARETGRHADAEKLLRSAARLADRAGLRRRLPAIWRDLLLLVGSANDLAKAERYARAALKASKPRDPGLPTIAREMAAVWVRHGHPARVLRVLRALATDPDLAH